MEYFSRFQPIKAKMGFETANIWNVCAYLDTIFKKFLGVLFY
jgi:hypothetical protein